MITKLVIGLQNPGSAYAGTRHNAGGWFAEALANHYRVSFKPEKKLHAALATFDEDEVHCKIVLPSTFMNQSGLPAREIAGFYRVPPENILVVHDELDLAPGRIKLKTGGGHGGHNGLRDITAQLGSSHFNRLRIGIGHPGNKEDVVNYVLGKPKPEDRELITEAIHRGLAAIPFFLQNRLGDAMNLING